MIRKMKNSGIEWIGEIPEDWKCCRLKNYARICNGQDCSEVVDDEGIYPVMGSGGEFARSRDYLYNKPSVLLGRKGTIDRPIYVDFPFWSVDTMYYTQINKNCDIKFFYYLCTTIRFEFYQYGSAVPSMTQRDLNSNRFVFIPMGEQISIANYLDIRCTLIDQTIEKQKQVIEKLKEYKQSVITEAVTKGLNPNVPMKDSGIEWIGEIPTEWQKARIKYCTFIRARLGWKGLKAEEYVQDGFPLLSAFNIINDKLSFEEVNYIDEFRFNESPEIKLSVGDILLLKDGAGIGKCACVLELPVPSTVNGSIAVLTPNDKLDSLYIYYYFESKIFQKYIDRLKDGMGVPHLFQRDLRNIEIAFPNIDEQRIISNLLYEKCSYLEHAIYLKEQGITKLESYKKSLIYECVTGKREVK